MIELSEAEQSVYLANAMVAAYTDSFLSPKELAAIDEIRSAIGAKKGMVTSARKLVEAGGYTATPCGDFATQVVNLSDMLYVCLIDGELSDKEVSIVARFSSAIGLTAKQLDLMHNDASERVGALPLKVECPKCAAEADSKAKICPNCGTALWSPTDEAVKMDLEIRSSGHSIEFAESISEDFPAALEIAKSAPRFETCVRDGKDWHLANWPEESFIEAVRLADALGEIQDSRYYHNGFEIPWDETFTFTRCINRRALTDCPVEYCFGKDEDKLNPWGCKQLQFEWTESACWFCYGQFMKSEEFKNRDVWVFNKKRIRGEVITTMHLFRRCPFLRPTLVEAVLNALPEEVDLSANSGWKYSRAYGEPPGSIKITEVDMSAGYEFREEYFSDGIRPVGLTALRQVLMKAFDEAKVMDVKVDQLLK
ncbi:MAG: zinc ribbon domain-containing protein [Candidatus Kryptoniota bacterium]